MAGQTSRITKNTRSKTKFETRAANLSRVLGSRKGHSRSVATLPSVKRSVPRFQQKQEPNFRGHWQHSTQSEVVARLADLRAKGVFVRTLDGLLNTAGLGKLAPLEVGLLTGLAEVERNLFQERTRESVEHRRRTGGKLGGPPPLTKERQQLGQRLRAEGKSYPAVAQALGVSDSTAHRYGKEAAVA